MFVVFEGIDGSGKTTVSGKVAKALRKRGIPVDHVREDGTFSSALVSRIREFGKDTRNLAMQPLAELLLYSARDAQLVSECIRPALDRGVLVFADRYFYSHQVLAQYGRGLPQERVRGILDSVADGLWPDLVVLMDVDPFVARARRRVAKLVRKAQPRLPKKKSTTGGTRKGLSGVGTQHRLRAGYLALAASDPERWLVIDNSHPSDPDTKLANVVRRVTDRIAALWRARSESTGSGRSVSTVASSTVTGVTGGASSATLEKRRARKPATSPNSLTAGRDAFFATVAARAQRERRVAAYFLTGIGDTRAHDMREAWADDIPHIVAYSLRGLSDPRAWALRERLLFDAPHHVARSLSGRAVEGERAMVMRQSLAGAQPKAILATLSRNDGDEAWLIREQVRAHLAQYGDHRHFGWIVASLAGIDSERAWDWRERLIAALPPVEPDLSQIVDLMSSLAGMASERAWELRQRYLEIAPIPTLGSLSGVADERAWTLREQYVERASKTVLRTFDGSSDPRAHELRRRHAPMVKEALDSMSGLDDPEAWKIREDCRDIWPSTVVKSLGPLGRTGRGLEMALDLLQCYPENVSLLKHVTRLAEMVESERTTHEGDEGKGVAERTSGSDVASGRDVRTKGQDRAS